MEVRVHCSVQQFVDDDATRVFRHFILQLFKYINLLAIIISCLCVCVCVCVNICSRQIAVNNLQRNFAAKLAKKEAAGSSRLEPTRQPRGQHRAAIIVAHKLQHF